MQGFNIETKQKLYAQNPAGGLNSGKFGKSGSGFHSSKAGG